jgi:hypothetical protein
MIGMSLTIPNRITNLRNTYETFKPYEPSKIIGDTTPKLPEPPPPPKSKGKCGGFGKILVAAVSIVVAIVLPFVAPAVFGIGAGLLGAVATAVASNLAGQVVANIVGLQDGFNFASVAVSALTAGISFGVLGVPGAVSTASGLTELGAPIGPVGRAVAGNLINQGVSIALGQQKAFSWAAVAGAAVSAGVTQVVSGGDLLGSTTASPNPLATLAGNLAGGVVRAALSGGKVNFVDIAADAFGNALGTAIGQSITQNMGQQRQQLQNAYAQATHEEMAAEPEPVPMPPTRPDPWKTGSAPVEFMDYVGSTGAIAQRAAEIQDPSGRAPSAVRGAESFDLEGLARVAEGVEQSQEPRIILAANSVVHYDLVGLIASKFSLERARVQEIMNYSQWPDQVGLLDAPTQGYRNVTPMSSDQTSIGKLYAESLHALNGMSPTETIGFALQMIKDNPSDNAIAGMALHPLVDATFHSYRDSAGRLVTYTAPIGHFFDGHEPDYVTPLKVTVATESLITAFEYISGKQLDNAGRQEIHDLVNDRMNRATQLGGLTLPPTTLEDGTIQLEPRPSEEMDRSFRQAIRELFRGQLQPEDTPLRIPVDRGSVTYGTTLRETATYLGKTLEEAVPFVDNGLRAAAYIANRYVDRYNPAYFGGYLDPTNRMGFDPGPRGRSR